MFSALLTRTKYIGTGTPTPPGPDYSVPLTIKMIHEGTFCIDSPQAGMKISINGAAKQRVHSSSYKVNQGDIICLYGNKGKITNYKGTKIYADVKHDVYGNIMSLVDELGYASNTSIPSVQCFYYLFVDDKYLRSAKDLLLPATSLTTECYTCLFRNCAGLIDGPTLPATSLVEACYAGMFVDCKLLQSVTCLATSGINQSNSTESWLKGAGCEAEGTKTLYVSTGSVWPTNDNSGIPDGWTRENV